jgi:hypothetical protein
MLLRAATFWLGLYSAVITQDLAGLSHSKTVEFTLRLPAILLTYAGAFAVFAVIFFWLERVLDSKSSVTSAWVKRFCMAAVVALCVGAPILSHLSFPASAPPGT